MLRIRSEQFDVLGDATRSAFVERACAHVRRAWPRRAAALGDDGVRASIEQGIERAGRHGITRQRDVIRFIDTIYLLGEEFDRDPRYPWAAAILGLVEVPARQRMDELWPRVRATVLAGQGGSR